MERRFTETAKNFNSTLTDFHPYPAAKDRKAYEALPAEVKERVIKEGESYLGYEYPVIRATDFMNFKRTGNRVDFESVYFARRQALSGLVLAECVEHQGRFLDDIINGIFAICEESAWQLPPHNSYIRNAPQELLPDSTRPVMDLFACETGATLAAASYLLQAELDEISPFITKRIRHELDTRIVTPYLTEHFWWMGKEDEEMCNWTPWCTQNVLLAAFLVPFDADTRKKVWKKASESCDYFLKDYGDDGCCDEGAQYYRHAGLSLFNTMDILNQVSGNHFAPLYQWDKIKNIACYILNVHVDDKYYFNFADCSAIPGRCSVSEYLFGKAIGHLPLMQFAAKDFQTDGGKFYTDDVSQTCLFYRTQTIFTYEEVMNFNTSAPIVHGDVFYPSVGLFIVRTENLALAVKAGDNNDSHNHNDTGSFTLYKNGKPVFADIGVESYTKKTFSPDRYEIWTMQSGYHNLPTINGLDEKDGETYCATNVETLLSGDKPYISMELASAYPLSEQINLQSGTISYIRTVTMDKTKNEIEIADCTNAEDVILNFITYEEPTVQLQASADSTAENTTINGIIRIGSLATATFSGACEPVVEVLPITDPRLQKAWDHDLYRVRLKMTGKTFKITIS